jgi:hypothetical protein
MRSEETTMAAYVKQKDLIILALSRAEAEALERLVTVALMEEDELQPALNGMTLKAQERAVNTLRTACAPGSRIGAAYD